MHKINEKWDYNDAQRLIILFPIQRKYKTSEAVYNRECSTPSICGFEFVGTSLTSPLRGSRSNPFRKDCFVGYSRNDS